MQDLQGITSLEQMLMEAMGEGGGPPNDSPLSPGPLGQPMSPAPPAPPPSPFDQYEQSVLEKLRKDSPEERMRQKVKQYYEDLHIKKPDSFKGQLLARLYEGSRGIKANLNRPHGSTNLYNDAVDATDRLSAESQKEYEKENPFLRTQAQEIFKTQRQRELDNTNLSKTAMQEATKREKNDIQRMHFLALNGDLAAKSENLRAMTEKIKAYTDAFKKDPNFARKTAQALNYDVIQKIAEDGDISFADALKTFGAVGNAMKPTQEGIKQFGTDEEFNKYVPRDKQLNQNKSLSRPNSANNSLVRIMGPGGVGAFATKQQVLDSLGQTAVSGPAEENTNPSITIPQFAPGQPGHSQLAFDNNNPGNLMFANQTGATVGREGYAKFNTPEEGYQALLNQIQVDQRRGFTLAQYISKYAPKEKNDTAAYIQRVATTLGLSRDAPIAQIPPSKMAQIQMQIESGSTSSDVQKPPTSQLVQNFAQSTQKLKPLRPFDPNTVRTNAAFEASRVNSHAAVANALATIKEGREGDFMGMGEGNVFMKFLRANTNFVGDSKSTHEVTQNITTSNTNNLHALAVRGGRFSDQQAEAMSRALVGDMGNPKSVVRAYAANMLLVEMQQKEKNGDLDASDITPELMSTMSRKIEQMVNEAYAARGTNLQIHIPELDEILKESKTVAVAAPGAGRETTPTKSVDDMMKEIQSRKKK